MAKEQPASTTLASETPRLFDLKEVPADLQAMKDDVSYMHMPDGTLKVKWGWRQWQIMQPALAAHIRKHGRVLLGTALRKAQQKLPKDQRRSEGALATISGPNARPDVLHIIEFLSTAQAQPRLALVTESKPANVPAQFKAIGEDARTRPREDSPVTWGWKQWRIVAPSVHEHLSTHGRAGLVAALVKAQQQLPASLHRTAKSWATRAAPSSSPNIVELVTFIMGRPPAHPVDAVPKAKAPRQRAPAARSTSPALAALPAREDPPAAAPDAAMQAFLSTPISAFLPSFRAFLKDTLRELMAPQRDLIAEAVRAAVIDVVGPPVAPAAPAAPAVAPDAAPVAPAASIAGPAPAEAAQPEAPASTDRALSDLTARADVTPAVEKIAEALHEAPHDLESQLKLAAKALGLPTAAPRVSVLVVGLHPTVEQECERFYGRAFRFTFKRPDAFNCAGDLPSSTDAILLCRKKFLPAELVALTRRYSIPTQHVQNNSAAVMAALRDLFPAESSMELHA